ncbi:hypothetical protein Poly24_27530 [Rosistilla carotiformis]|uniref:Endonuclease GajA/Old nuclease/RecF-like AAA domain-containing protein n=1 Tax=Rosistilla carotiformis TaxID=2528017 RepID=A0A518JU13_9BACT|nr:DUF3696 domain-containing protein [Rosistilla carotiformis]QDV69039.1 hypothetical protein Poly24_27530 [Rosistilla carotiformis]
MLKSIELENFKAFGQRTTIPLAPITLIFGQNSSGKSSILQSLNLLKQSRESRDADALLLPRAESGLTDLGSFHEMLFDHDEERQLRIRIETIPDRRRLSGMMGRYSRDFDSVGLELMFSRKSAKDEISLDELHLCNGGEQQPIATYQKVDLPREMRRLAYGPARLNRHRNQANLRAVKCVSSNADSSYWASAFNRITQEKERLIRYLKELLDSGSLDQPKSKNIDEYEEEQVEVERSGSPASQKIKEFVAYLTDELTPDSYRLRMAEQQLGQYVALDGFIPIGAQFPESHFNLNGILLEGQRESRIGQDCMVDLGNATIFAGRQIDQTLANLFPLGPFRKSPSRWYVFSGTTPQDVGFEGQSLPDLIFRKDDVRDEANEWLKRLDIGYELRARSLGNPGSDLFELRLLDTRRKNGVEVGLSDVGFGISQILPLIVQSLAASDQIISIEQPEVHIHPRLQADLGDLLIEATKEPRRNQFLIETHSEHLALRLQRRVREKQIAPEDISILYVSRGENGSTVTQLRLDEDGDFMDDFPGGFFPERLRELR